MDEGRSLKVALLTLVRQLRKCIGYTKDFSRSTSIAVFEDSDIASGSAVRHQIALFEW